MNKIELCEAERSELESYIRRGKANVRNLKRAHILLKSAEGWTIERIAEAFGTSLATVSNVQARYQARGVGGVLNDKYRPNAVER